MTGFETFARPIQTSMRTALGEYFFLRRKTDVAGGVRIKGIFSRIVYGTLPTGQVEIIRNQQTILLINEDVSTAVNEEILDKDVWNLVYEKDDSIYGIVDYRADAQGATQYILERINE